MKPRTRVASVFLLTGLLAPRPAAASGGIVTSTGPWTYGENTGSMNLGAAVSTAGDVNGDGFSDILVGAGEWDGPAGVVQGKALVFLGSASGVAASPAWTGTNTTFARHYGMSVTTAGDVNGDGYDDIAVGTLNADSVYVHHGSPAGPSSAPDAVLVGVTGERFGHAVNTAGDVNGDGYDDLIVGSYYFGGTQEGRVTLFLGSPAGLLLTPAWSDTGDVTTALMGYSVGAAGDVDADGYDDILVGAYAWEPSGNGLQGDGKVYCYSGNAGGTPTLLWTYEGDTAEHLGERVAGAGDVNGDGYADILAGGSGYNSDSGRVLLFYGSPTGPAATPSWSEVGLAAGERLAGCATAGDVNADGIADFLIAEFGPFGGAGYSEVRVYLGARPGPSATPVWSQGSTGNRFGDDAGTAGDVDGDGFSDVLIGAPFFDSIAYPDAGRVHVYRGCAGDLAATTNQFHLGLDSGAREGDVVADAGDVNGDGFGDFLVGAPMYDDGSDVGGQIQLFYGSQDGPLLASPWVRYGAATWDRMGTRAAGAGDVNGDGFSDFVVCNYGNDPGSSFDPGAVELFYGSSTGPVGPVWTKQGVQDREGFGYGLDGAGDVNCDGFADVIIGAPYWDGSSNSDGRVEIYFGSAGGLSSTPDWTKDADGTGGLYGYSVAGAGDLDGDGFDDVLIGAPYHDGINPDTGAFYIFLGSPTGPGTIPDRAVNGSYSGARMGFGVGGAGDVNADGYADFVVGLPYYDGGGLTDRGRIHVYHGGPFPISVSPAFTADGLSEWAQEGQWVACAGDVNGDGYSDIISGSPYDGWDSALDLYDGRASVWLGSVNGIAGARAWTIVGAYAGGELGTSVSGAGDVNGDGYGDVIVGEPVYAGGGYSGGRCDFYHGSGTPAPTPQYTPSRREYRVLRASGPPVHRGNRVDPASVRLLASGWGPGGRTKVGLEWQAAELGTPLDASVYFPVGSWVDSGPVNVHGLSATPLDETLSGLDEDSVHHVRFRVATRSPYFPHTPWLTPADAPAQLGHFKTGVDQVGIPEDRPGGVRAGILRAWPNPFWDAARIAFANPAEGRVELRVYDAAGHLVAALPPAILPAGEVELSWDGRDIHGRSTPQGVYFLRVDAPGAVRTGRLLKLSR